MYRSIRAVIVRNLVERLSSRNYSIYDLISKTRAQWCKWSVCLHKSWEKTCPRIQCRVQSNYLLVRNLSVCEKEAWWNGWKQLLLYETQQRLTEVHFRDPVSHLARVQWDEEALSNERSSSLACPNGHDPAWQSWLTQSACVSDIMWIKCIQKDKRGRG